METVFNFLKEINNIKFIAIAIVVLTALFLFKKEFASKIDNSLPTLKGGVQYNKPADKGVLIAIALVSVALITIILTVL